MKKVITLEDPNNELIKTLKQEAYINNRAQVKIQKLKKQIKFTITAKDKVAMKAAKTSIKNALTIFTKIKNGTRN